jgi:ABC-type transport system involved in multi-copper enzyme maturation permease subunit
MADSEELIAEERAVATYAQPLSRLQVSWGSVLAGALAISAVSLIVWLLALAIIFSAMPISVAGVKGAVIAGWVCAIVTTLAGGFVGGMVAGYLPGNPRRAITLLHGFLAWGVAFVVSLFIHASIVSGAASSLTSAVASTAGTAVQTAGAAVGNVAGGAAGGTGAVDQKAMTLLESIGYSPQEATSMVSSARQSLQDLLRGQGPAAQQAQTQAQQTAAQVTTQARGALDTLRGWTAAYLWLYWATWAAAGGLAVLGAQSVLGRTRRVPERERASGSEPIHVTTLRPARTIS